MIKTFVGGSRSPFTTVWKTNNAGTSSSTQITWPTIATGTYNCTVYWGDGNNSVITTFNDAAWTHTYSGAGTYTVRIVGTFDGISFNNGGDKLKLLQVLNWGGARLGAAGATNNGSQFFGCTNLTIPALDTPDLRTTTLYQNCFRACTSLVNVPALSQWNMKSATSFLQMFFGCTNFNTNINQWNTSSVTNFASTFNTCPAFNQPLNNWVTSAGTSMANMFIGCTAFNQNISGWNTALVTSFSSTFNACTSFNQNISTWNTGSATTMLSMFNGATSFNQNLGAWNITKLVSGGTGGTSMFTGVTLSTANYNGILAGWGAQTPLTGVTFNGGNSHYDTTTGGFNGTAGRAVLTGTYTWTITDGGTP